MLQFQSSMMMRKKKKKIKKMILNPNVHLLNDDEFCESNLFVLNWGEGAHTVLFKSPDQIFMISPLFVKILG